MVSVYALTNVGDEGDKDPLYQQLESVVEACPAGETSLVLGDCNAVVGSLKV